MIVLFSSFTFLKVRGGAERKLAGMGVGGGCMGVGEVKDKETGLGRL